MIRSLALATTLGFGLGLTTGCGETCQSTCFRAYDETQCDVPTPGQTKDERISDCLAECRSALREVGPVGDYSPFAAGTGARLELENERQAAAWMDCIANATCEQLQARQCNPL